mgnify:CR=1 FL=1
MYRESTVNTTNDINSHMFTKKMAIGSIVIAIPIKIQITIKCLLSITTALK